MMNKESEKVMRKEAQQIADVFNTTLLTNGCIPAVTWRGILNIIDEYKTIQQKNALMRRVVGYLSKCGYITFKSNGYKLIIGDQSCAGKRIVITTGGLVWDPIAGINGITVWSYMQIFKAYNSLLSVDAYRSRYTPEDKTPIDFNKEQWEELTKGAVEFNRLEALNLQWREAPRKAICLYCGTQVIMQNITKLKVRCPRCGSVKMKVW